MSIVNKDPNNQLDTKQKFTTNDILPGCKVYVSKDGENRLAEILQEHLKKGRKVYYVHYQDFNKRLDEWIEVDRIDFSKSLILPEVKADSKDTKQKKNKSKGPTKMSKNNNTSVSSASGTPQPSESQPVMGEDEMDLENLNVQGLKRPGEEVSREEEIKSYVQVGP